MKLAIFIAKRYLFSRKKKSVIHVISWISLIGISVGSMALIIVLSVYNGIGNLTQSLFNVFDPELKIEASKGKTFHLQEIPFAEIQSMPQIQMLSTVVEENMWITYRQRDRIVTVRGVDNNYAKITGLDTLLYKGSYALKDDLLNHFLIMGMEIYYDMGISDFDSRIPVGLHVPKRESNFGFTFEKAFNSSYAFPSACFMIQNDIDSKYVIADIDFTRELMNYTPDEVSFVSLTLKNPHDIYSVKQHIQNLLGPDFSIKDRFEQQPLYYKIFQSERIGIFLILSLIVLIATLNLIASLSLLIIDKRKDIHTLQCLGANKKLIRAIFFTEGIMISFVGVIFGLVLGFIICLLQQQFGIIKMGDGNFVVNSFPVMMQFQDFISVFILVLCISALCVGYTVHRAKI